MYRKCFASILATILFISGLLAEEIKGVFKKFEDNKLTIINADGKEETYKVDPDVKLKATKKDRTVVETPLIDVLKKPAWKDREVVVSIEKDLVKMVAITAGKKKSDEKKPKENNPPSD